MLPESRRLLTIGALVVLLGAVGWSYFGGAGTRPASLAAGAARQTAAAQSSKGAEPLPAAEGVRLSTLSEDREEPSSATRNPFRFQKRAPVASSSSSDKAPVFQPAPPPDAAAATGPPPPPPIPLKFIGVVEKGEGARWAVLSVGDGRAPLHGKEGDIIDGRYRILKIGNESIDMAYLDGRGRQTIRLTGQ